MSVMAQGHHCDCIVQLPGVTFNVVLQSGISHAKTGTFWKPLHFSTNQLPLVVEGRGGRY